MFTTNAPVEFVREDNLRKFMEEHPDIHNIVLFDDAAYSGNRISDSIVLTNRFAKKPDDPPDLQLNLHVVVPFSTHLAHNRVTNLPQTIRSIYSKIHMYTAGNISTLAEQVAQNPEATKLKQNLKKYFELDLDDPEKQGIGLTYFEHKLPDDYSFLEALALGNIPDDTGKVTGKNEFISKVTPPYKQ